MSNLESTPESELDELVVAQCQIWNLFVRAPYHEKAMQAYLGLKQMIQVHELEGKLSEANLGHPERIRICAQLLGLHREMTREASMKAMIGKKERP